MQVSIFPNNLVTLKQEGTAIKYIKKASTRQLKCVSIKLSKIVHLNWNIYFAFFYFFATWMINKAEE